MSFSAQVTKWAIDQTDKMQQLNKAVVLALFNSTILDSPVLTGRLRGNWIITSDDPSTGTVEILDPQGSKTIKKVEDAVSDIKSGEDFDLYLTNNLPYAYRIEFDGYSKKAPEGMVRKNFIRITNLLSNA